MVLLALVEEVFPLRVPECNGSVGWLSTAALHNMLNENLDGSFDYRPVDNCPFSEITLLIFVKIFPLGKILLKPLKVCFRGSRQLTSS